MFRQKILKKIACGAKNNTKIYQPLIFFACGAKISQFCILLRRQKQWFFVNCKKYNFCLAHISSEAPLDYYISGAGFSIIVGFDHSCPTKIVGLCWRKEPNWQWYLPRVPQSRIIIMFATANKNFPSVFLDQILCCSAVCQKVVFKQVFNVKI